MNAVQISLMGSLSDTSGRSPVDAVVDDVAQWHQEGFRRVWLTQRPPEPDLLTVLAVVLREVDSVEVGSAVIPIQNQHPMLLAQRALTLSMIGKGRFILGLGLTQRLVTWDMWGIPWDKPLRRLGECLDCLQPLLAGETADAVGEIVTTRGSLQIPGAPAPDVYVAALGPQMLRLAGQRTAGTVTWMTGPTTLAEYVVPTLRAAAVAAGRPENAVRVVAALPVSVTDDVAAARATAAEVFGRYAQQQNYRDMFAREGIAGPADLAFIGDEHAVTERIQGLSDAGVDELIGVVFESSRQGQDRTRALLRQLDT